jgi:hypothetical protein
MTTLAYPVFAAATYVVENVVSGRIRMFGPVTGGWQEVEDILRATGLDPDLWAIKEIEEVGPL